MTYKRKSRYWEIICYPDSLPENYEEIIGKFMIPVAQSPIHDKDKWEDTTEEHQKGDYKKAHYHLLLCFEGPTTYNNVITYAEELNTKQIRAVSSSRGMYEYLTHKNNPEKAQYEETKIKTYGGFSYENTISYSETEIEQLKRGIINIINEQEIEEYKALYDYFNYNDLKECCSIISRNTIFFNAYLKSKKFMVAEESKK